MLKILGQTLVVALATFATNVQANEKLYLGFSAGYGKIDIPVDETLAPLYDGGNETVDLDDSSAALSAHIGYRINRYFALEAGYVDLGEYSLSAVSDGTGSRWLAGDTFDASVEASGLTLAAKIIAPITDYFALFGKAGIYAWDIETTATIDSLSGSARAEDKDDGTDPYFSAGGSIYFEESALNIGFTRFDADGDDLDVFYFGVDIFIF